MLPKTTDRQRIIALVTNEIRCLDNDRLEALIIEINKIDIMSASEISINNGIRDIAKIEQAKRQDGP